MTEFTFSGPNGKEFKIQGPEGATLDDAKAKFEEIKKTRPDLLSKGETSVAADVAKSGGIGLAKGLIGGTVALPGNIADLMGRGVDWVAKKTLGVDLPQEGNPLPTSESVQKRIEGVTGPFYKPQTRAGEYAQTVGEFVGDPTSYVGPGGALRKVGGAVAGGLGSETAGQLTKGTEAEPLARIIGGVAGQKAAGPRPPKTAAIAAPSREELLESSGKAYEELKNKDVPLRKDVVENLSSRITTELNNDFHPQDQPRTYRAVERLKNPLGEDSSAKEVYSARTALNHIIGDLPGTSEAKAARLALERLDEYLSNVPGFAETAKRARGDYRAAKQSERVTGAQERGELNAGTSGSGANKDNALRQRIKALYLDKKVPKSPEEAALMKEIAMGTPRINIARLFSKLGPKHPLTGWGSALAADLSHGSGLATATLAVGALAQHIAERGTAGKVERLDEMARRNSPLGRAAGSGAPQAQPTFPWGELRGGLGAVPGALEAGGGSPLAQEQGP